MVQWKGQALPSRWDDICPSEEMGEDRVHYDEIRKWAHLAQTLYKIVTRKKLRKIVRIGVLALWSWV